MIELQPGQKLNEQLIKDLRELVARADEIGQGGTQNARHIAYRRYSDRALRALRYRLAPNEITNVLQTRAHWALLEGGSTSLELIDLEGEDLKRRMTGLLERAKRELDRWSEAHEVVVPDTNVFLRVLDEPSEPIASTDWWKLAGISPNLSITVVLPIAVVDELDRAKRNNQTSARARATLKEINRLLSAPGSPPAVIEPHRLRLDVVVPPAQHVPLAVADDEIVSQVETMEALCQPPFRPRLLTNDTGMMIRAKVVGLDVRHVEPAKS